MKNSKNTIYFVIGFFLFILVIIFFYLQIVNHPFHASEINIDANSHQPSNQQTETKVSNAVDQNQEIQIPILMYHHIRNFNDPNDQIGTNLSVSPENFKLQMDFLKNNGYATVTFDDYINQTLPAKPVFVTFDDGYSDAQTGYEILKANGQIGTFYVISSYLDKPGYLSTEQVKNMSNNEMAIGSHTAHHPDLTKISSEKLVNELTTSKKDIEDIIGKPVVDFCYPAGKHNQTVDAAVEAAGYKTAVTTSMALSSNRENHFTLSRLRITPSDSITSFSKKLVNTKKFNQ